MAHKKYNKLRSTCIVLAHTDMGGHYMLARTQHVVFYQRFNKLFLVMNRIHFTCRLYVIYNILDFSIFF